MGESFRNPFRPAFALLPSPDRNNSVVPLRVGQSHSERSEMAEPFRNPFRPVLRRSLGPRLRYFFGHNPGILAAKDRRDRIENQIGSVFALFAFLCG
jgi:hypothetical protein